MSKTISTLGNVQTMSSLEIALLTGKQHDNIIRDIRKMLNELKLDSLKFEAIYKDKANRSKKCFNLLKRETLILVSGYNIKMRAAIIDRWQELEAQPPKTSLPPQLIRYMQHIDKVPLYHFCAMELVYNGFISKLSIIGHDILEEIMPDGSFSRMFSDTLRADGIEPQTFPDYPFVSIQGYHARARAYPMKYYERADKYLHNFWLPKHAPKYLAQRDRLALQKLSVAIQYLVKRKQFSVRKQQITLF